jgi:hypothetical protein
VSGARATRPVRVAPSRARRPGAASPRLPEPLPPPLAMDAGLVLLLTEAEAALAGLSAAGVAADTALFAPACAALEALHSCRLAGLEVGLADLYQAQVGALARDDPRAAAGVTLWRTAIAFQRGFARVRHHPFDLALVDVVRDWLREGEAGDAALAEAAIAPALDLSPAQRIALEAWAHFAVDDRVWMPPLIRCALLQAHLEALALPDGREGRLARVLAPVYLAARRQLAVPVWFVSAYWQAHRARYRSRLRQALRDGVWEPWLEFFLLGVRGAARSALIHLHDLARHRAGLLREVRGIANAPLLVDALFINPCTTAARAAQAIGRTLPTANVLLQALEEQGVLHEITGRRRHRVYLAPRVLNALQRLPPMA